MKKNTLHVGLDVGSTTIKIVVMNNPELYVKLLGIKAMGE